MTKSLTNSDTETAEQILRELNDRYQNGERLSANGREIWSMTSRAPVMVWGNGAISIEVRQRSCPDQSTMIFVKRGQALKIEEMDA